jgi:hypothetical protein
MRVFKEMFDNLHCTEAVFGQPVLSGRDMLIPVEHLPVLGNHPLFEPRCDHAVYTHPKLGWVIDGEFFFHNVFLSRRIISEYIGNPYCPEGFGEREIIEDVNIPTNGHAYHTYEFEGGGINPPAVISEWLVMAEEFELRVDVNNG